MAHILPTKKSCSLGGLQARTGGRAERGRKAGTGNAVVFAGLAPHVNCAIVVETGQGSAARHALAADEGARRGRPVNTPISFYLVERVVVA
jgi:hypothetical protein